MDAEESIAEVHTAIQRAIENWGHLLIATSRSLKPKKYIYHLIDFAWTQKGGVAIHHTSQRQVRCIVRPVTGWDNGPDLAPCC